MTDDIEVNLVGFLENFTTVQPDDAPAPRRRISCLHLYSHYLKHCQKYGTGMAPKAHFAAVVYHVRGCLPEAMPTGDGSMHNFFDRLIFTGQELGIALRPTPEMQDLLREHSPLDEVQSNVPGGMTRQARTR